MICIGYLGPGYWEKSVLGFASFHNILILAAKIYFLRYWLKLVASVCVIWSRYHFHSLLPDDFLWISFERPSLNRPVRQIISVLVVLFYGGFFTTKLTLNCSSTVKPIRCLLLLVGAFEFLIDPYAKPWAVSFDSFPPTWIAKLWLASNVLACIILDRIVITICKRFEGPFYHY